MSFAAATATAPNETARWLLDVDFDPADRQRIAELCEKAREGTLSAEEDAELEDYGDVGRLLELLKANALAVREVLMVSGLW